MLLITGLGFAVIVYDTFWAENLDENVDITGERNQTKIPEGYEGQPGVFEDDEPRALNETGQY